MLIDMLIETMLIETTARPVGSNQTWRSLDRHLLIEPRQEDDPRGYQTMQSRAERSATH